MKIIIDCNVWISFLLGFQKQWMRDVQISLLPVIMTCWY